MRLDPAEVDQLVAAHLAGAGVKKLAAQFGVHRDTIHHLLERKGVLRRRGIRPGDIPEAIRLYEDGWSLVRLAAEFDVSPSTVNRALRKAGVPIRRPGPPRARGAAARPGTLPA
jgi:transposase-like protein